jgi:hypothetical protein
MSELYIRLTRPRVDDVVESLFFRWSVLSGNTPVGANVIFM